MTGTFDPRMAQLADRVGYGDLVGSLYRNQRYAAVQERDPTLRHPHGGSWRYQETALYATYRAGYAEIARTVLTPAGPAPGMQRAVEMVDAVASGNAPRETTVLARSGAVRVYDDGRLVAHRAAKVPRLTDAQLRAGGRRSGRGRRRGR